MTRGQPCHDLPHSQTQMTNFQHGFESQLTSSRTQMTSFWEGSDSHMHWFWVSNDMTFQIEMPCWWLMVMCSVRVILEKTTFWNVIQGSNDVLKMSFETEMVHLTFLKMLFEIQTVHLRFRWCFWKRHLRLNLKSTISVSNDIFKNIIWTSNPSQMTFSKMSSEPQIHHFSLKWQLLLEIETSRFDWELCNHDQRVFPSA